MIISIHNLFFIMVIELLLSESCILMTAPEVRLASMSSVRPHIMSILHHMHTHSSGSHSLLRVIGSRYAPNRVQRPFLSILAS